MNPALTLLQWTRAPAVRAFEEACRDVEGAQRRFLLDHVARHAGTDFGRQHGYSSVRSVEDFRLRVPVAGYDAFSPYIDRMLHGEANVLVPERVKFWSATAGTTGYRKLVPITDSYRAQFQLSMHLWLHGVGNDHPRATSGKVVYFVAPERVDAAPDGTLIGNMSGYNYRRVPAILRSRYAVPAAAFELRDPDVRAYTVARCALAHDVTWLVAISSHPLYAVFDTLRTRSEALLKDLAEGTLSVDVPPDVRSQLRASLAADPARAAAVRQRAASAGALTPRAAWPNLALMTSWTHGAGAAFLPDVMAAAPGVPVRGGMYAASEGWFTVPRADGDVPGVLVVNANFYEFIPVDASGRNAGEPLLAHQLADGGQYNLVVTTGAGLARYCLDDIVAVDGFHGRAPRLRFVQKAGSALNLYHDLTTETQARTAVEKLAAESGVALQRWAMAAAGETGPGGLRRYLVFAEWVDGEARARADSLGTRLDELLQDANYNYKKDRGDRIIAPLRLVPVKPGALARVQQARARQGHAGDQMKPLLMIRENALRELLAAEELT